MRLLLITYEFPPKGGPGIQRPLQTTRLLDAAGWDVTVLTVMDPPTSLMDHDAEAAIPSSVQVARAWSLEPTRLLQFLRQLRATDTDAASPVASAGYSGAPSSFIRFVQAFFLPDEKVGWTRYAMREAERLHGEQPFDVILASGPPFSALRVAWKLSARWGVPWVADVRDPIVDNYFFRPPTAFPASYMRRFERRVVERAARTIIGTSDYAERAMSKRNPRAADHILTITNGFDPADFDGEVAARDNERFTVSYVGSFQGDIRPEPFLDAVKLAFEREPALSEDLRVRIAGSPRASLAEAIVTRKLEQTVRLVGFVPHEQAIQEMRTADALLLVLADLPHLCPTLTGKLPEYLGARKPILGLVPQGAARDVLERTGAAEIVAPNDVEATADALLRLHAAWRAGSLPAPDPDLVAEFDRTKLVARLGQVLERVVSDSRS
ncbi:MAG: glycosyltransferase [Actinomycetota bacterium]|jgi:glycosyltransferase involved in cell wall biosynthesis|nr:glycosyltransferase [Actinomycetota bacterium]